MSVSKMRHLTVFAPRERIDDLVKKLIRLRCVEITKQDDDSYNELSLARLNYDAQKSELEDELKHIDAAIVALNPYVKKSKGLFAQKRRIDLEEFNSQGRKERARKVALKTVEIVKQKEKLKEEKSRLEERITSVIPYVEYDLPLGFTHTRYTDVILGVLPSYTDTEKFGKELYDTGAVHNVILADKNGVYVSVFCHTDNASQTKNLLASYGFIEAAFQGEKSTAKDVIRESKRSLKFLAAKEEELNEILGKLALELEDVEALYDAESTELVSINEKLKLAATDSVVIVNGWIPQGREAVISGFLDGFECAYELRDPLEDEVPPILLQNNGFASNFEWVLGMYSYPTYGRFDPTFIMSIYYFIIFGIMFADVGYGLILVLACFGAVKFLKPSKGLERSLKMFGYCGLSSILFGALFGSYFGDFPLVIMKNFMGMTEDQLPNLAILKVENSNLALLMDPLQSPMAFLIFALGVGVVHLVAGMAVNFYIMCKDGNPLDAILDIGLYWALFAGIGMLFVLPSVGKWVALAAAVLIVLTHGRKEKKIVMKFAKGLLGIYDLINYASDLLSYSRILALGLSAGIVGQVVNILASMGGPTVGGFILLVAVFLLGHLLNLAINVLGTFVHTARLQYIEFFGKFYEDGGVAFEPAVPSEKYTEEN